MQKETIFTGLLIMNTLLLLMLIFSIVVFFKNKKDRSEVYQENLEQLEEERASIRQERAAWVSLNAQKDKTIQSYYKTDSIITANIQKQTAILNNIEKKNEKNTAPIRNYGSTELRNAFSDFK